MSNTATFAPQMVADFLFCAPDGQRTVEQITELCAQLSVKYPTLVVEPVLTSIAVRFTADGVADELALNQIASRDLAEWLVMGQLYYTEDYVVYVGIFVGEGIDRHISLRLLNMSMIKKGLEA